MIKICLITPNLLPVPAVKGGAIESLITNIIEEQEKEKKLDITIVSIYNEEAKIKSEKYKETKFIYVKKNVNYMITSIIFKLINKVFKKNLNTYNHVVLNKIKKENFDYIIAEGGNYESYNKYLKYYKRSQLILHLHHQGESNEIVNNTFSKLIAVSDFVKNDFAKSAKKMNLKTVLNGIDTKKFKSKSSQKEIITLKKKYGIEKDDFVVLYCGRLVEVKGVLELIKAVNEIENKKIKLLILGSSSFSGASQTEYTKKLEAEASKLGKRIMFTGYVNNWELYKYYEIVNIMCMPSLWEEAAGLTGIEAMLSGKVVLATNSGGVKEYLNEKNCLIVEKNKNIVKNIKDGILALYENKDKLPEKEKELKLHAEKFNSHNLYKDFCNVLESFAEEDKYEKE